MLSVCANSNTSYYLGDLPGTIQYKKDPKNIISAVNELQYDDVEGWNESNPGQKKSDKK